jgi:hypothetical protein
MHTNTQAELVVCYEHDDDDDVAPAVVDHSMLSWSQYSSIFFVQISLLVVVVVVVVAPVEILALAD